MNRETKEAATGRDAGQLLKAAMACHEQGDLFEADLLYAELLQLQPGNARALRLRGILARERGDLDTSLKLLAHALELTPGKADILGELALTQMASGDLAAAEAGLREAAELAPDSARQLANLGALLHHRGHLLPAIDCYTRALELEPDDIHLCCNLAKALADTGRNEAALAACDRADAIAPGHPAALAARGAVLTDARRYAAARDVLAGADAESGLDDMAQVNLALCLQELGDIPAAAQVLSAARRANPYNARAVADLANCLCALDDCAGALDVCESFLRQNPGERLVVAAYALALRNAGDAEAALPLTDCDLLVQRHTIPCPAGFADSAAFNAALAERVRADASLRADPISKSTLGGAQTGELDWNSGPELASLYKLLNKRIKESAEEYIDRGLASHPAMLPASDRWHLRGWGTRLVPGGRQTPHMHPLGWLSGVYYVALPPEPDPETQAGWLEFGRPPDRFYRRVEPDTRRYRPAVGTLIIFPSWLWHRTLPFSTAGDRVSIAFDVVPQNRMGLS